VMDKQYNVYSYSLLVKVLEYETAIVREDFETANECLQDIPAEHHNRIARFLEGRELKELALEVSNDPEHRFELAMQCHKFQMAREILLESESELKWKQLGDAALNYEFNLKLAEECYVRSKDFGGLLLLYTSLCDQKGMERLGKIARENGHNNVAFLCLFLTNRIQECINLLCETDRIPEAAFMTRTYLPSQISRVLTLWKENLKKVSVKAAESLGDPHDYEELCPDLKWSLKVEKWLEKKNMRNGLPKLLPAYEYERVKDSIFRNLIQEMKDGVLDEINDTETIPTLPESTENLANENESHVDVELEHHSLDDPQIQSELQEDADPLSSNSQKGEHVSSEQHEDAVDVEQEVELEDSVKPEKEETSEPLQDIDDIHHEADGYLVDNEIDDLMEEGDVDVTDGMSIEELNRDLAKIEASMADDWGESEQY